jgi:hypothetical protein
LDGVFDYDPLSASYAFSPIGYQGAGCGGGNTEDCRYTTALKYRVNVGQFRAAVLWQFGGHGLNNAANGAYQFLIGADISDVPGMVSLDGIYSHVKDPSRSRLPGTPCRPCCTSRDGDVIRQHDLDGGGKIRAPTGHAVRRL